MIASIDYPTLYGIIGDDLFIYMLNGENDPWMFHQANVRNYDGAGHSLLSDVLDAAFHKYEAVMTLPIVSPTMDNLAARVKNRMALDASGVVATIAGGSLSVTVAHAATVPVTGLCVAGAENYGGQTISYLTLTDGQTATYPLGSCGSAAGTGGTPGNVGSGGAPGTNTGAGGAVGTTSGTGVGGSSGPSGGGPGAGGGNVLRAPMPAARMRTRRRRARSPAPPPRPGRRGSPLSKRGCGCELAAAPAGSGVLPFALLGISLAARRRRTRA